LVIAEQHNSTIGSKLNGAVPTQVTWWWWCTDISYEKYPAGFCVFHLEIVNSWCSTVLAGLCKFFRESEEQRSEAQVFLASKLLQALAPNLWLPGNKQAMN
jgi:hypothetical protein